MEEIKSNEQLSKKEQRQLRRQEKNDEQGLSRRKKKMKKSLKWSIGILVAVGAIYGLVILSRQDGGVKQPIGESFPSQGREHIAVGASHEAYNSNPPTSGPHYEQPSRWGVSQAELPDEQLIHNVEPRAKNDAPIVLASWERLLKLEKFDEQIILDFIKSNKNRSPEPFAQ